MSNPLPLEAALIKAVADLEVKYGALGDRERLLCKMSFAMGHGHGLETGNAVFDQVVAKMGKAA